MDLSRDPIPVPRVCLRRHKAGLLEMQGDVLIGRSSWHAQLECMRIHWPGAGQDCDAEARRDLPWAEAQMHAYFSLCRAARAGLLAVERAVEDDRASREQAG